MKTISLQQFHSEVMELAKKAGKHVAVARVDLSEYSSGGKKLIFECYVEDFNFHSGTTPKEAILKLKAQMFPRMANIKDVTIETNDQE